MALNIKVSNIIVNKSNSETDLSSVGRQSNKDTDCWICYDSKPDQELINPCMCKGDVAFVHHECLRRWLSEENKKCSVCNFEYEITRDIMDFDSALKNIHWALVVPSFVLILFIPYGTYLICCQAEKHAALDKHRTLIQSSAVIICLLIGESEKAGLFVPFIFIVFRIRRFTTNRHERPQTVQNSGKCSGEN